MGTREKAEIFMADHHPSQSLIGLLPAAGKATRIQPLPCSKELMPIGFQTVGMGLEKESLRPKVVSHYLLDCMHHAGVRRAYFVINRGKWDIPAYYGPGTLTGIDLAYVVTDYPYGAPFSLKQAFPFVSDATILLGFPDIVISPVDCFTRLLKRKAATGADLVLGLFRAADPAKMDMVELDDHGKIKTIDIKPKATALIYTWIIAVWSQAFTIFMQTYLDRVEPTLRNASQNEPANPLPEYYVGQVIQAALKSNLSITNVIFEEGTYTDIGTPDSLVAAMTHAATRK